MEIKKIVEDLELANDVNMLSLDKLENKYLKDEETYKRFLDKYGAYFDKNANYRCRVIPLYKKITTFMEKGNDKFKVPEFYEKKGVITYRMNQTLNEQMKEHADYSSMALFNFICMLGADIVSCDSSVTRYNSLINSMYEAAKKYEQKNGSLHDFLPTIYSNMDKIRCREDVKELTNDYLNEHSLSRECNDINFLYFVNYMLGVNDREVDASFLEDAHDVMKVSDALNKMSFYGMDCNYEVYKKTADRTKGNIKYFNQERNRLENKSKRKIKQLFT